MPTPLSVVYDSATKDVVLALDACVPSGELWERQHIEGLTISGPLSLLDAGSCPESVNMTQMEFDDYFEDRVAIYVGSPQVDEACEKGLQSFTAWVARLTAAGAAGAVYLSPAVNHIPGIWYSTFTTGRALASESLGNYVRNNATLVPFVHCAITDSGAGGLSDSSQLHDFFDTRMRPLAERLAEIPTRYVVSPVCLTTSSTQGFTNT
jgi:hypothetical protein